MRCGRGLCRVHKAPDMPGDKWQRGVIKAQAADTLSGGALAQRPNPPPTAFRMEVAALDVGLHFVEVEAPDSSEDRVRPRSHMAPGGCAAVTRCSMDPDHIMCIESYRPRHATLHGRQVKSVGRLPLTASCASTERCCTRNCTCACGGGEAGERMLPPEGHVAA